MDFSLEISLNPELDRVDYTNVPYSFHVQFGPACFQYSKN